MTETPFKPRVREIPYNYTSFSDREIVIRLIGAPAWDTIESLRTSRKTGRSARMLFEVLGDIWAVKRNPYLVDDLIDHPRRLKLLVREMSRRLEAVRQRAAGNADVYNLISLASNAVCDFEAAFPKLVAKRAEVKKRLSAITAPTNIRFDGFARVTHVTDATDWRVEYPFVVVFPDREEEIAPLVRALFDLKLTIIPRSGGTGYTGGAVPLDEMSALINMEKFDRHSGPVMRELPGVEGQHPVIECGAGCVTRRIEEAATAAGLVFAVDPASADACCIGGNVAINAGGKKATLWGTTIDNLAWWKMVNVEGKVIRVERVGHNFGRIHEVETAEFDIHELTDDGQIVKTERLSIPGRTFRKEGLGKDVTDKYLCGLPAIQKEGTDGIVMAAAFVLHRMPTYGRTVCLEFYGTVAQATPAIVEVRDYVRNHETVQLAGLEHIDWRYVRAVGYRAKEEGRGMPKMVLLADIVSDNEADLDAAAERICEMARARTGAGFIARTPEARKAYWKERSRTAAIAKHTNAFKLNEDVVIPLERLGEYSDEIERINIEFSFKNKIRIANAFADILGDVAYDQTAGIKWARELTAQMRDRWVTMYEDLDALALPYLEKGTEPIDGESIFLAMRDGRLRISIKRDILKPLAQALPADLLKTLQAAHAKHVRSRLFVALHMHAGDGNVHTNLPVNSDDYGMMQDAEKTLGRIMALAERLGGVISGEHGIGLTKFEFLSDEKFRPFREWKERIDPEGRFNRGKLMAGGGLERAYTPSFELFRAESLILENSGLGAISQSVKNCLRCGKCKPVCTTHIPRANLLYSPRNKILALGLMTEAFLYESQTRRGLSLRHFNELVDLADHCTICHRCVKPCPVKIDFGHVTTAVKAFLARSGYRDFNPAAMAGEALVDAVNPIAVRALHAGAVRAGYKLQRMGHELVEKRLSGTLEKIRTEPRSTTGRPSLKGQVIHLLSAPLPNRMPAKTMRQELGIEEEIMIPILRRPDMPEDTEAVFYFPGCGSEKLFGDVGLAVQAMLWHAGVQTVLPPGYRCCGHPQLAYGNTAKAEKLMTENRVLFHRMANTLNYLDIRTVVLSCGTCIKALDEYDFNRIFPGCRIIDIHEFLLERGITMPTNEGKYLYHDPCHTPLRNSVPLDTVKQLTGANVVQSERCCGESGLFAVKRPDIASQVRTRKFEEIEKAKAKAEVTGNVKMLTTCPGCLQGLSRYEGRANFTTDYVVVEMARQILGANWRDQFIRTAKNGGIEKVYV